MKIETKIIRESGLEVEAGIDTCEIALMQKCIDNGYTFVTLKCGINVCIRHDYDDLYKTWKHS